MSEVSLYDLWQVGDRSYGTMPCISEDRSSLCTERFRVAEVLGTTFEKPESSHIHVSIRESETASDTLGLSQDVCKGARSIVQGKRCVVSS